MITKIEVHHGESNIEEKYTTDFLIESIMLRNGDLYIDFENGVAMYMDVHKDTFKISIENEVIENVNSK